MALKPWYSTILPREDLRQGKPLDAAEFAVHLDHVRDGIAPDDYKNAERFFERTYLTQNMCSFAAEVLRRLSGEKVQTSAVFNLATQFGGGKTHALTMLYHLAQNGPSADTYQGVNSILIKAGLPSVPRAATAVFIGTEFDSITGRGGSDGTPIRKTPWGEIAYQLGGEESLALVQEHDSRMIAPGGEVIRSMLPKDVPCIILIDELMNYISRSRGMGTVNQIYSFLQDLSEVARSEDRVVLVVSIPASELEMTTEDFGDYDRFKKLLNRLGKPVLMSTPGDSSEIIRRRLFKWDGIPEEGRKAIKEYTHWAVEHRQQIPADFSGDNANDAFRATYPFHPAVISVFERKWQSLPKFQQTRGVLQLLALWVSINYQKGVTDGRKEPLIDLGSAPLDDPSFRAAVFEQLGEEKLQAAITTDIAGKRDSHATMLDINADDAISKARLHQKIATSIFFESNGGQSGGDTRKYATLAEIRFAVGRPDIDIANVETVLEALAPPNGACYYLHAGQNRYWFSLKPNLTKLHSNRIASMSNGRLQKVNEICLAEIQRAFQAKNGDIRPQFFPDKSGQVPDRPELSIIVLPPRYNPGEQDTHDLICSILTEYGSTARTFKSALIFALTESDISLREQAKKLVAWEDIRDEQDLLGLDPSQKAQVQQNIKEAQNTLKAAVWRSYRYVILLRKGNTIKPIDLGLNTIGSAPSLPSLITGRLKTDEIVTESVKPTLLVKYWPPALTEWSTKNVRDMFYASPDVPRILDARAIKGTIAKGVTEGMFGYCGEMIDGVPHPLFFEQAISPEEVEISDEMFIIPAEAARAAKQPRIVERVDIPNMQIMIKPGASITIPVVAYDQNNEVMPVGHVNWEATGGDVSGDGVFTGGDEEGTFWIRARINEVSCTVPVTVKKDAVRPPTPNAMEWSGQVQPQKWMNFYTKVLSRFATRKGLSIEIRIHVSDESGISQPDIDETRSALRELGLNDNVSMKRDVHYADD